MLQCTLRKFHAHVNSALMRYGKLNCNQTFPAVRQIHVGLCKRPPYHYRTLVTPHQDISMLNILISQCPHGAPIPLQVPPLPIDYEAGGISNLKLLKRLKKNYSIRALKSY